MNFANNLKNIIKNTKITQQEIAKLINVAPTTYLGYEKGTSEPTIETLTKLADFYNTTLDDIVGRKTNLINIDALSNNKAILIKKVIRMNEFQEEVAKAYLDGLMGDL